MQKTTQMDISPIRKFYIDGSKTEAKQYNQALVLPNSISTANVAEVQVTAEKKEEAYACIDRQIYTGKKEEAGRGDIFEVLRRA